MTLTEDLKPAEFPELDWSSGNARDSLAKLRDYTEAEGDRANQWYLRKRVGKRIMGRTLRIVAILFTAAAALAPVVSQIWQSEGVPLLPPGWSPLLLGAAGLCVLLDKFLGTTSAWLRYLTASQEIGDLLRKFGFDWEMEWAALGANDPTDEQTQQMIARCRVLVSGVDRVVREETQAWVEEFKSVLTQIDKAVGQEPKLATLGGIDIEVSNGDQATAGWTLRIDDGSEVLFSGKKAAVNRLVPGLHKISVSGDIGGTVRRAEQNVHVHEGVVESVSMTLA